jgi:hypothetical protein
VQPELRIGKRTITTTAMDNMRTHEREAAAKILFQGDFVG